MLDPELIERIRTIFLHEQPCVSIADATVLLGWSRAEMNRAIGAGDIEVTTAGSGKVIPIEEVIAQAIELWPLETIEAALAKDAALALPPARRGRSVVAYLPAYQVQMLEHLASSQQTTVGQLIAKQLDDLAEEHIEELSMHIAGFAEAFEWPHVEQQPKPC